MASARVPIPLKKRPLDLIIVGFFSIALVIVFVLDLEQVAVANPQNFTYPAWPPKFIVDSAHWWGKTFDPVLSCSCATPNLFRYCTFENRGSRLQFGLTCSFSPRFTSLRSRHLFRGRTGFVCPRYFGRR